MKHHTNTNFITFLTFIVRRKLAQFKIVKLIFFKSKKIFFAKCGILNLGIWIRIQPLKEMLDPDKYIMNTARISNPALSMT